MTVISIDAPASRINYTGNEKIDPLIANIKQSWRKGVDNRSEVAEFCFNLRKATKKYQKDEATGLTFASAIRRTGMPRSTALYYAGLWEGSLKAGKDGVPVKVFFLLAEAGFNLAKGLDPHITVAGIMREHPELCTGDIEDYASLAETLQDDYAKEEVSGPGTEIATLQQFIREEEQRLSTMPDSPMKELALKNLEPRKAELHTKQVKALTDLAKAVAPLVGKNDKWAEGYAKELKDNRVLTSERYADAVTFAQSLAAEMDGGE